MEHNHQRKRLPVMSAGDEELVGSASRLFAIGALGELRIFRHDVGNRSRRVLDAPQAQPGAVLGAVEQWPVPAWGAGRRLRWRCAIGLADVVGL